MRMAPNAATHRTIATADAIAAKRTLCSPLPDERIVFLPFHCLHRAPRSGQLQHGCVLAFAQPGEQHGLPVGELQRIVMHPRLAHVDLPESRHLRSQFDVRENDEKAFVLDLFFERDFCAG
jgi:hypothetical protein